MEQSRYKQLEQSRRNYEAELAYSQEKKRDDVRRKINTQNQELIDAHQRKRMAERKEKEDAWKRIQ